MVNRVVIALVLSVLSTQGRTPTPQASAFKTIAYIGCWTDGVTSYQWDKLTQINYAFLIPSEGQTVEQVPNPPLLEDIAWIASQKRIAVFLSVGGQREGRAQREEVSFAKYGESVASSALFADHMMKIVDEYGLDGIDVDWEFPADSNGSDQKYANLMLALCNKMHVNGKQCSTAVPALYEANGIIGSTFSYIDSFNIMAYDMNRENEPNHSPYSFAVEALNSWKNSGIPASRLILVVPFFGKSKERTVSRGYKEIMKDKPPPTSGMDVSKGVYYNGIDTIKRKAELARQQGGGIGVWELSQDTSDDGTSLLSAIKSLAAGWPVVLKPPTAKPREKKPRNQTKKEYCQ